MKALLTIALLLVRAYEGIETALYHSLRDLPEPEFTHEFC
jgi:hypothetical protein